VTMIIESPVKENLKSAQDALASLAPPPSVLIAQPSISVEPSPVGGNPSVLIRRLEKKLAQITSLRQRVESGEIKILQDDQVAKLASESGIVAEIARLRLG
jgi:hypothetical protein